jgi:ATPase subunit of ABC transporter with duplicated ATPase domains
LDNFNLTVNRGDRIAFVGPMNQTKSVFFDIISGDLEPDSGEIEWGVTISKTYFPKENQQFFGDTTSILDWLREFSPDQDDAFVRGFLGRMLFSGEDALKSVNVLSGGERVRCMLSKMMLSGSNVLIFDEPTNHLDLESIQALNNGLIDFSEVLFFNSHDHQFVSSIANRIIEFTPHGVIDRMMGFEDYLDNEDVAALRDQYWENHQRAQI